MRRRLSFNGVIITVAAAAALILTVTRPAPEWLISFGVGDREVRAAPGKPAPQKTKHNLTALEVFNRTLVRIQDGYVDPSRIDPKEMLYRALDSVQFDIPEVLVEANKDADEAVIVVNDKRQKFSTSDVESPWRLSSKLKRVFRFIEANMNPGADLASVEYAAVNGMLRTLDPHSVLLDPETAREMNVSTSGHFGGLGIVIRMHKRKLTVVNPMKGTPAHRAGVKRGDHIAKINNESTDNLTLQEAVDRMRGKKGTSITLWIQRKGQESLLRFDLVRARIEIESVVSKLLDKNVGYISVKQFSGRTSKEVSAALSKLTKQGAKGWILDLRWNPGGLLEQAIQVSDLFVDKGTIVTTVGGRERDPRRATRKRSETQKPMVILVNGNSASASEIVAGALKNLGRAAVVGSTSFGKGSVQILYDNSDGSKLKLTIAQYLTPGDRSIQSVGIKPDIALDRMFVPAKHNGPRDQVKLLATKRTYREADLRAHLTSRYARNADETTFKVRYLYEPKKERNKNDDDLFEDGERPDDEVVEDFELRFARDLVSVGGPTRESVLKAAKPVVERVRAQQQDKLSAALTKLGVDWSLGKSNVRGKADLRASVNVSASTIAAGSTLRLVGSVTNVGQVPAYQVHGRVASDDRKFDEAELVFGKIAPGATKSWTTELKVPDDALDRIDMLRFNFTAAGGLETKANPMKLRVKAADRPVFAYSYQLVDHGNGDGLVQRGEKLRLHVTIKNIGTGQASQTSAMLRNASGAGVVVKKGRFEIGKLKPGASTTVEFEFEVTTRIREPNAFLEMTVYDARLHESITEKLKYRVNPDSAGPAPQHRAVLIERETLVHEGADKSSARFAVLRKGSVLAVTGKLGKWLRLELGSNRPGFVLERSVSKTTRQPTRSNIEPNWQVTPPKLALAIPHYETRANNYVLQGTASDDTQVEDVYIFVSNRDAKIENRKVYYKSNRSSNTTSSMLFEARIPLWPGNNRVTVVARENDKVRSSTSMYLYRVPEK